MFKFFSFNKKKPKEKDEHVNSLLLEKLDRVIELLEQQPRESNKNGEHIHLEHVQIDHLENIIFRLDHIEIDELSGKLLIGTNITGSDDLAVSLLGKIDKENMKKETADENENLTSQQKMTKTEKGFRFHSGL